VESQIADLRGAGLVVGHAGDHEGATGVTVIRRADGAMRAGVSILGRATGSRELHAASADHLVNGRIDAILLTGGSAYGLDAAAGVMRWMEERGRGLPVGIGVVPIVPAAVVFDLAPLGRADARPSATMAYDACDSATDENVGEGSVGVGTGTTVGKIIGPAGAMKGGFGCASEQTDDGSLTVAAMVVVNAFGDVRNDRGEIIAGARGDRSAFVDTARVLRSGGVASPAKFDELAATNTTLAVVGVSAPMTATELTQLARAAGAALTRRITPCGSSFDGDIVFAVSPEAGERSRFQSMIAEALAVAALERAVERAVRLAHGRDGIPGLADTHGN
jgi:L-aminopeptidase/D-esterase-like protein